jgi:hypothetical protein
MTARRNIYLHNLPPEARLEAMHTKLPRSWRVPVIGLVITLVLHLVVATTVWLRSQSIEVAPTVFFVKLFPLPDQPSAKVSAPATQANDGEFSKPKASAKADAGSEPDSDAAPAASESANDTP